jgi:hypothetical protein
MRVSVLCSVAALGLLATPAMAQTSGQQQGQSAASSQQDMQMRAMSRDRLAKSLEQAGFKNVTVVDATYLVAAQSPNGDQVMMLVDPPAVSATSGGSSAGGSSNQQQSQGSSTQQ